ncbi:hypothetical protein CBS147332_3431 [Penicillium roqueforti]|nr:hypothetical protein CBS147355_978 [Penicillium roqueforti]KAI2722502.1 hypothetical protein CBS147332_3431 [Penicillium roqueforti]KAI3117219.1 hypothetical protein CBS147331_3694 [Penicillium roqueforti]KAI3123688.1 hypothetical protein CBS147330_7158 [Penicillium roqueforti]
MAPITKTLALAGAFFALTGYSAPVAKRAVVWETVTDVVWTTIDVTTTIYPQSTTSAVVPVVATAVPTTTAVPAPVVVASTKEQEAAPVTTSTTSSVATTTAAAVPTVAPVKEEAAPTTSSTTSSTTTAAVVPTVEASVQEAAPTTTSSTVPTTTAAPLAITLEADAYSAPTTTAAAETSSTAASTATRAASVDVSSSGGACSEGSPCDGDITFYDTATTSTNPSSCGTTNDGTVENVLALPHGIMTDSDCGKTVTITYNGQTATGTVVDKCMGCDNNSVDLSRHFFGELAPMDKGRVSGAKWYIN